MGIGIENTADYMGWKDQRMGRAYNKRRDLKKKNVSEGLRY
jgi:hypothetical protein